MNGCTTHAARHPALRCITASTRAARAIDETAFRFTQRPVHPAPAPNERTA